MSTSAKDELQRIKTDFTRWLEDAQRFNLGFERGHSRHFSIVLTDAEALQDRLARVKPEDANPERDQFQEIVDKV